MVMLNARKKFDVCTKYISEPRKNKIRNEKRTTTTKIVHFVISGENKRFWNEHSVATRAKRVWIVSEFHNRFRHKLQTVLFIIHALTCFLIQVSEKQLFWYHRVTFRHGFDKWAFRHKKQMQYLMFSLHVL